MFPFSRGEEADSEAWCSVGAWERCSEATAQEEQEKGEEEEEEEKEEGSGEWKWWDSAGFVSFSLGLSSVPSLTHSAADLTKRENVTDCEEWARAALSLGRRLLHCEIVNTPTHRGRERGRENTGCLSSD